MSALESTPGVNHRAQVYAAAAPIYRDAGWPGVLPLTAGKMGLPAGYTGHNGKDPDTRQVNQWCRTQAGANIALRMPDTVVGIDVDHYDKVKADGTVVVKRGADELEAITAEVGVPLPPTWVSSARDEPSGIRLYRVPAGRRFVAELTDSIEIIRRCHRHVVAPPSTNPEAGGAVYRWRDPHGVVANRPPMPDELAELPAVWVDRLTDRSAPEEHREPAPPRPVPFGAPARSQAVQKVLDRRTAWTAGGRHPQARKLSMALVRLEGQGHPGVQEALDLVGSEYVAAVQGERGRNPEKEYADLVTGGRQRAATTAGTTPDYADVLAEKQERDRLRGMGKALIEQVAKARESGRIPPDEAEGDEAGQADGGRGADALERHRHTLVDWDKFWNRDPHASDWLLEPILPRGRGIATYSPPKAGKSLLSLDCAASLATGRRCIDQPAGEPVDVLYVDAEMTEDDLHERLADMGYGPGVDLSHLHYHVLPDLAPLDTAAGGRELAELAEGYGAELVILDTVAAVVVGAENDSDTYRNYWTHTGRRLKQQGRTVWRLDHAGKDPTKGQRGSSAKAGDVDLVWELNVRDGGAVRMRATHRRVGWAPEVVDLVRHEDPLRHDRAAGTWPPGTKELAAVLDGLEVPDDASRSIARAALKAAGRTGGRNEVLAAALRWRRPGGSGA